jgi:hypothetical protein
MIASNRSNLIAELVESPVDKKKSAGPSYIEAIKKMNQIAIRIKKARRKRNKYHLNR